MQTTTPYVAARYAGTRYHWPQCQALTVTRERGNEVRITRAAILAARLLPCGLCTQAGMPQVTALAAV